MAKYSLRDNPPTEDPNEKLAQVVENKPSSLLALLPADTASGSYTVEARTRTATGGTPSKTVKKGSLERAVTVTA